MPVIKKPAVAFRKPGQARCSTEIRPEQARSDRVSALSASKEILREIISRSEICAAPSRAREFFGYSQKSGYIPDSWADIGGRTSRKTCNRTSGRDQVQPYCDFVAIMPPVVTAGGDRCPSELAGVSV